MGNSRIGIKFEKGGSINVKKLSYKLNYRRIIP